MNQITQRQIVKACRSLGKTTKEISFYIEFFDWYYWKFQKTFGIEHKHLTTPSIEKIIDRLDEGMSEMELCELEELQTLATKYFQTRFENCDYSISHFSNLEIMRNRYFETLL